MLGKILGFLDIVAAALILLYQYHIIPGQIVFAAAFYLLIKAVLFFGDFLSVLDGIVGIYMLFMLLLRVEILSIVFALYLIIKGLISMA